MGLILKYSDYDHFCENAGNDLNRLGLTKSSKVKILILAENTIYSSALEVMETHEEG